MQTMINKQKHIIAIVLLVYLCFFHRSPVHGLSKHINSSGVILADAHGKILYQSNSQKQYIPASILKILTSLTAFRSLGEDYRFKTGYYFDKVSKNLYLKGFGDPLFISEVIAEFCQTIISTSKPDQIRNIIIDQSFFSERIHIPGKGSSLNPYDATVGALCANFNTIMFKQDKSGKYISAEPQTPLLDIFQKDIKAAGRKEDRIILNRQQSILYPGQLVKYFLEQEGVNIFGDIKTGIVPVKQENLLIFRSPYTLGQIVQKLLEFSNNFMANQLLLTMGAEKYSSPATIEKGINLVEQYYKTNLKIDNIGFFEGSGLSRSNQISPEDMLKILIEFKPYHQLLKHKGREFFKTGTLTGIRTRAGYIVNQNGQLYPYVIMLNNNNTTYDKLLKKLFKLVPEQKN